jgi:hypothetical protein
LIGVYGAGFQKRRLRIGTKTEIFLNGGINNFVGEISPWDVGVGNRNNHLALLCDLVFP